MPTYLTPGVYVEEVPSANKPIEGVSTSIAAFVGLAPGGPVNTPMRISNWTQFAKIYGDPNEPDNGPFMEGAYLAHSVYGFFQNGGSLCWIVRVGDDGGSNGSRPAARAALPAAADSAVEAFSAVALRPAAATSRSRSSEEPSAGEGADKTYTVKVSAGCDNEEFTGLPLKKGRNNLATKVNAQSKLIKIEETGASLPDAQRVPAAGTYKLSAPSIDPAKVKPTHFEGDVARRRGMGGLAAVDEVTMVVMPDIMALASDNGDDVQIRDLQGKMIAHCENAGDRMAILDCPPDMLPQEILEWRMNTAGYDSKFAALYYPWIEVQDPLTNKPMMVPPSGTWPACGAARTARAACTRRRPTRSSWAPTASASRSRRPSRAASTRSASTASGRSRAAASACGARGRCRATPSGATSTSGGSSTSSPSRSWRARSGACSSPTTRSCGSSFGSRRRTSSRGSGATARCSAPRPAQAFYVKCDSETNPPEVIEAGQVICEIGISPVKPAEFVVFRLSQFSGGEGSAVSE